MRSVAFSFPRRADCADLGLNPPAGHGFFNLFWYVRQLWPLLRHPQLTLLQIRPEVSSG